MELKKEPVRKENDVMMNMDVYPHNQFLRIQFDIIYQPDEYHSMFDGASYLIDLGEFAEEYVIQANSIRAYDSVIPSRDILNHLLLMQNASARKNNLVESIPAPAKPIPPLVNKKIIYELSSIPHQMINWMGCFGLFLEQKGGFLPAHKQFGSHEKFDDLMEQPITSSHSIPTIMKGLMERLIAYRSDSEFAHYHKALDDLKKLYDAIFSIRAPNMTYYHKPFMEFFSDAYRCEMLYKEQHTATMDKTLEAKDMIMFNMAINMAEKTEFLFMSDLLNTKNRIDFLAPCLEKKALDGNLFTWEYTELLLIYFGEFRLCENNCMGIIHLDKNPVYEAFYQQGKIFHTAFHDEIQHLFGCLCLQLQPDQDFHQQKNILFHPDCTPDLMNRNLHLNSQYCKNLFQTYLVHKQFKQYSLAKDNVFSKLPEKALHKIILEGHPSLQAIYRNGGNSSFFRIAKLGEEEAIREYEERSKNLVTARTR